MSRSGYSDDFDEEIWSVILWRGAVAKATKGKRGQKLLQDLLLALESMPEKQLISGELRSKDGVCALGALGQIRGMDLERLNPEDRDAVSSAFGVAPALIAEITYMNDEFYHKSNEERYEFMVQWVRKQLVVQNVSP